MICSVCGVTEQRSSAASDGEQILRSVYDKFLGPQDSASFFPEGVLEQLGRLKTKKLGNQVFRNAKVRMFRNVRANVSHLFSAALKGTVLHRRSGVLLAKENEFPLKTRDKTVGLGLMGKRKTGTSERTLLKNAEKAKLRTALFLLSILVNLSTSKLSKL